MERRLLALLVLPLTLTACGDDDARDKPQAESSSQASEPTISEAATETTEATESTESTESAGSSEGEPLTGADRSAIEDTLKEFLLTGDCDLATDDYLRDLSLFSDDDTSRAEACAAWENAFVEPLYTKEDILLSGLEGSGGVVTIEVGSEIAPDIKVVYQLSLVDGEWLVSGDEINTDGV